MRHIALTLCIGAFGALLVPPGVAAQTQSPDTTALSPVVVTATKIAAPVVASTAATSVISGAELRAKGAVSLLDALRTVPGIALAQTSGPGSQTSIFLRGGNSNFTKVLVDGVPLNAPGGAIDLADITTDDVDRIEIVRGPASALYGSDAMTGVIQIFTKHGGPSTASVRVGDADARYDATASLAGDRRLDETTRVHGAVNGGYHRGNGFLPFNNQFRDATASAAAAIDGVRGSASLSASLADARYHYPTNGSGQPVDSNAWTGANRLSLSANALWRATEHLSARAQLGRATRLTGSSDLPDSPGDTSAYAYFTRSHGRAERDIADVQLVGSIPLRGWSATTTIGGAVEGQRTRSRSWNNYSGDTLIAASRTNRALYAQVIGDLAPFTLDISGRRERLTDDRSVNTGRAAVAARLLPGTILRASLATAFKEPALEELYGDGFSIGESTLRPERNRSREAGLETRLPGDLVTLGVTAFDQQFRDMIQYRYIDATTSNYYNVLAARARGWELEGRVAPIAGVATRGSYTIVRTDVTNAGNGGFGAVDQGKPLLRRPKRSANVDASWALRRASFFATITRVGARDDYDFTNSVRRRLEPYTLVDLSTEIGLVGRAPSGRRVALTLRGENVGGAKYQNVYGFATPGRMLYVGVRARE